MWFIVTLPLGYVYGPFSSKSLAEAFSKTPQFATADAGGIVIRRTILPEAVNAG